MAVLIKFFVLICMVEIVWSQQFPDNLDVGAIQKGPTLRTSTRFFPRQPVRSNIASPSVISNQRIRRPIPLKGRPVSEANEISSFTPIRPKPTLLPLIKEIPTTTPPSQLLQRDQPIKPVNEEAKEEEEDENQAPIKQLQPTLPPGIPHIFPQQAVNIFSSPLTPRPEPIIQFRPSPQPAFTQPVHQQQQHHHHHQQQQQQQQQQHQHQHQHQQPQHHQQQHQQQQQQSAPQFRHENIPPVQYRPQKPVKLRKPIDDEDEVHIPVKQQYQHQPSISKQSLKKGGYREKKPVALAIRRWREDNADGSITWGYENDDGSYKEEVIGVDCITRGKYGYVGLDGVKREYSYETGIRCDEQEEEEINGFVDYSENKLVLPNGKTIDLSNMGKKQARRPSNLYRN